MTKETPVQKEAPSEKSGDPATSRALSIRLTLRWEELGVIEGVMGTAIDSWDWPDDRAVLAESALRKVKLAMHRSPKNPLRGADRV